MEENQFDSLEFLSFHPEPLSYTDLVLEGVQLPTNNEGESRADGAEGIPHSLQPLHDVEGDLPEVNENYEAHSGVEGSKRARKELCHEDKVTTYNMLLQKSNNGKLKKGTTGEVALCSHLSCSASLSLCRCGIMERERKQDLLDLSGFISNHLETDIVQMENRVLMSTVDIEELEEVLHDMKVRQDAVMEDQEHEGLAITIMESFRRTVNHLSLAIAHMKQKREVLNLALASVRAATQELNNFGNVIPGILTMSTASDSD